MVRTLSNESESPWESHALWNGSPGRPLGMGNGAIADDQLTVSSSEAGTAATWGYTRARLQPPPPPRRSGPGDANFAPPARGAEREPGAWLAGVKDTNQYFQMDLKELTEVTGIATQGR